MKVLIISGDIEEIVSLYPILTRQGCDVLVEAYGQEGVVAASGFEPDVILLDIALKLGVYVPSLEWNKALQELKSSSKTKDIPVIVLGDLLMDEIILDAKILGAVEILDRTKTTAETVAEVCKKMADSSHKEAMVTS